MRKLPFFVIFSLAALFSITLLAACGEGSKQGPPMTAQQQGTAKQETPPAAKPEGQKGTSATASAKPQSCYDVGFKIGRCAAKSMSNLPCEPGEDIPMPQECKGKPATEKGLAEGRKSVY